MEPSPHPRGGVRRDRPGRPARLACLVAGLLVASGLVLAAPPAGAAPRVIRVPVDYPTIQQAVAAASSGDTILLSPGVHQGGVWVQDKALTFESLYATTGDRSYIDSTVVEGYVANACGGASGCAGNAVIEFGSRAAGSVVEGLTVRNGVDGVRSSSVIDVRHSRMTGNSDGVDYGNGSGGSFTDDRFDHNTDDGLDLNGRIDVLLQDSTVEANEGDGIEFRMYPYTGPTLNVVVTGNRFVANDSDGIQLIDSDDASSRVVTINRNVFDRNGAAAIGALPDQQTNEDFSGAPLAERVNVTDNTFTGGQYGVVGGANSIVLDNVFTGLGAAALRRVGGGSISAYNLFWGNGIDAEESVVDQTTSVYGDPLLGPDLVPTAGSPAIDAGTSSYQWNGETVFSLAPGSWVGSAPDLGAFESGDAGGGPSPNAAPVVDAGGDLTTTLPAAASLDGSVTDDGRPGGGLTTTWSQVSGPGTATFADPAAVDTTASFSTDGTYTLRLSADDGELTTSDTVQVAVLPQPVPGTGTVERRIAVGTDDAEEFATGSFYGSSSDLELVFDKDVQKVGMRFTDLTVPRGATVTRAWVQFTAQEKQSEVTDLTVQGQAADNPATFSSANKVSTRPRTTSAATWAPPAWNLVGEAGAGQRTPDLSGVLQEVVGRPGWASGNAVVLIVTGTGHRTASAFEGNAALAPLLHVEYATGGSDPVPNTAPTVDAGADQTVTLPATAALDGTVSDDGRPSGALTTTWSKVSGPGTVTFAAPGAVDTTATFSAAGTYQLQLAVSDGELGATDTVQVVVEPAPPAPNAAPTVDAGADQTVTLPAGAALDGTVADDGRPSGTLTTTWRQVSGPGTATFAAPAAVDTTATFSTAGTYQLELGATDGELAGADTVQVVVQPAPPPPPPGGTVTLERRIEASADDAEESATGSLYASSTDLELVFDKDVQQVGLRFPALDIPAGATVTRAWVQFTADEKQSEATGLVVHGQAADNPVGFSSANKVSTRPRTAASVSWAPPAWTLVGEAAAAQRTPDLAGVLQEVVGRAGWSSGNAVVLLITGTGHRTAGAADGKVGRAPLLHVEYTVG